MLRSYIIIALRQLWKSKFYSGLNVTGLLSGIASFLMRTKEIGIRKVLGAGVPALVARLSKNFLTLVVLAALISVPLAFWLSNLWLAGFAYRIGSVAIVIVLPCLGVVALSTLVLTVQTMRTATSNPVDSLRTE